jgi:hypothetical protein
VPDDLVDAAYRLLEEEGYWYLVDVVPASMPAHWVFTFFPEAWSYIQRAYWTAYNSYNALRQAGFQVKQKEHAFYWPVTLGVVMEIVQQRPGLLAALPDGSYRQGLERLKARKRKEGSKALVPCDVVLVEIMARKGRDEETKAGD